MGKTPKKSWCLRQALAAAAVLALGILFVGPTNAEAHARICHYLAHHRWHPCACARAHRLRRGRRFRHTRHFRHHHWRGRHRVAKHRYWRPIAKHMPAPAPQPSFFGLGIFHALPSASHTYNSRPATNGAYGVLGATLSRVKQAMSVVESRLVQDGVSVWRVPYAAAALVGNALTESSLDPRMWHDHHTGYGVYGARLRRMWSMLHWLSRHGYGRSSLDGQLRYMADRAMSGAYPATRQALLTASAGSLRHTVLVVRVNFESPSNYRDWDRIRGATAALRVSGTRIDQFARREHGRQNYRRTAFSR